MFKAVAQWQGPIMKDETTFEFLQRGGRTEATEIRQWIEAWFREYPENHAEELRNRFQSRNFAKFMAAHFELMVFSALRRLGCDVEVHPEFAGTHGKVDFGATHGDDRFYVEATVCGIDQGILCSNANEEDAVRKIREAIRCPHSDIWLDAEGELLKTLGRKRLVGPVQELLDSCSADAVSGLDEGHSWREAQTSIQEGTWRLDVFLARPIASDGKGRIYGPSRGGAVDGASPVAKALRKKAKHWADKRCDDATFLIAINACHSEYSWGDELRAIYGRSDPIVGQHQFARFLSRVAGVISFGNATLGNERSAPVRLYDNLGRSVPDCLRQLRQETSFGKLVSLGQVQ